MYSNSCAMNSKENLKEGVFLAWLFLNEVFNKYLENCTHQCVLSPYHCIFFSTIQLFSHLVIWYL